MQQISGWRWCLFASNWSDYDALDQLMADLRTAIGITYRIAYLTSGPPGQHTVLPTCSNYGGHAVLYNAARLLNLTAVEVATIEHDADIAGEAAGPHLRRSLPICNRGTVMLPLEGLIDGSPQRYKCDKDTPSGPSWVAIPDGDHIVGSFNRFAPAWDRGRVVDVFNVNPVAGKEMSSAPLINNLVDKIREIDANQIIRYFPPFMIGDFNSIGEGEFPGFVTAFGDQDVNLLLVGKPADFPSRCGATIPPQRGLVAPSLPSDVKCPGPSSQAISDHCAIFAEFEADPSC
jgi:hypothetical protein